MCSICRRFLQVVDCSKYFGQQNSGCDPQSMVCILTYSKPAGPEASQRYKQAVLTAQQDGTSSTNLELNSQPNCSKLLQYGIVHQKPEIEPLTVQNCYNAVLHVPGKLSVLLSKEPIYMFGRSSDFIERLLSCTVGFKCL